MTPVDTMIPAFTDANNHAVPSRYGAQVADIDGDGRDDFVLPNDANFSHFGVWKSDGPQDLLLSITDGSSPLDPGDPGFVPTVEIHYGNLVDSAITQGAAPSSLDTYVSRSDPNNDCVYPRACVVGVPARTVHVESSRARVGGLDMAPLARSASVPPRSGASRAGFAVRWAAPPLTPPRAARIAGYASKGRSSAGSPRQIGTSVADSP